MKTTKFLEALAQTFLVFIIMFITMFVLVLTGLITQERGIENILIAAGLLAAWLIIDAIIIVFSDNC